MHESQWGIMTGACDCSDMANTTCRTGPEVKTGKNTRPTSVPCKHIAALINRVACLLARDKDAIYRMRGLRPWGLVLRGGSGAGLQPPPQLHQLYLPQAPPVVPPTTAVSLRTLEDEEESSTELSWGGPSPGRQTMMPGIMQVTCTTTASQLLE